MARSSTDIKLIALIIALGLPLLLPETAFAATAGMGNIENFIRSLITALIGLAGLVATGFLVVGGFIYITSSGSPEHLDRGKRTITWALVGLAIVLGAFVLSQIMSTLAGNAFGG
ncbi:hypothetical protein E6P97_00975 [Patescibacteria group bacterium]|nr:MAG: hypothetical protein E6P97_00975 [Patescibacteria group bacterium]